jgi:glycosyltransferase involved in cell wall biosynthesis
MKKILIVSTVSRQFYLFEKGNIDVLKSLDFEVHCAANFKDDNDRLQSFKIVKHHFDIQRSPFSLTNIKAYYQLKNIVKNNHFNAIHCHSPMGSVLARLVAKSSGVKKVIYTAHGFHFYKKAPLLNRLIYYNIEKYLSKYTETIVTINKEDFEISRTLYAKNSILVPGIGIDLKRFDFTGFDRDAKRNELHIPKDAITILSVGELIKRKNYVTSLKAISKLSSKKFVFLICGKGKMEKNLRRYAKYLGIESKVQFLGFRNDIPEICYSSDIFLFPSFQEGLPVSVMEAMAAGLPIVASKIRGNTDLIKDGIGGFLHGSKDYISFAKSIEKIISDDKLRLSMSIQNIKEVAKYDKQIVNEIMRKLYTKI